MSDQQGSWSSDPFGRHQYRWFDGEAWSDQVSDDGVVTTDPPVASAVPAPAATPTPTAATLAASAPPGPTTAPSNTVPLVLGALAVVAFVAAALVFLLDGDDTSGADTAATGAPITDTTLAETTTTDTTIAETTTTNGADPAIPPALIATLAGQLQDESGLTADEARCFVTELLTRGDFDIDALVADPDSIEDQVGDDPAMMGLFFEVFDICGIDPASAEAIESGFTYGDNPRLDALWDACDRGDGAACDELYYTSEFGSDYEEYGDSCGGRFPGGSPMLCAEATLSSRP